MIVYMNLKVCLFFEFVIKNLELWEIIVCFFVLLNGCLDNGVVYFVKVLFCC